MSDVEILRRRFGGMIPGTGCHAIEAVRPLATPRTWRGLFRECLMCGGRKVPVDIGAAVYLRTDLRVDGATTWMCVACAMDSTRRLENLLRSVGLWRGA